MVGSVYQQLAQFLYQLSCIAWVVMLNACATTTPLTSKKYEVYEMRSDVASPSFSASETDEYVAWLDDKRVLFDGYDKVLKDPVETNVSGRAALRGLYIWNIHTGQVSRYTKDPLRSSMCLADGFISYAVYREGKLVHLEGSLGEEREVPTDQRREFNRFNCRFFERSQLPPAKFGGGVYPLRSDHGWLERIQGGGWTRPRSGSETRLTIPTLGLGSIYPHKYSKFADKYLYYHSYRSFSETWAFTTTGMLELLAFPSGPWGRGHIEPVRDGLLLRSRNIGQRSEWDVGYAGLYLHSLAGSLERIIAGIAYAMDVTRDGCLVAVFVDPWDRDNRKHQLKAVDICKKG